MMKKVLYIDMDNVIVDFVSAFPELEENQLLEYEGRLDELPNIFSKMKPMPDAIEAIKELAKHFDVYVLSTSPWNNSTAWSDKVEWIQKYFGKSEQSVLYKRLILSHHKNLNSGDYLIDDRDKNGADKFEGELIKFGSSEYKDWKAVLSYLLEM